MSIGEQQWASVSWENEMLYLCIVIQKESPTDLTDLHRFSSLQATVLTKAHSKNSEGVENLWKSVRSVGKQKLREESKIRSIREIRVQESGTAQRPLNINY